MGGKRRSHTKVLQRGTHNRLSACNNPQSLLPIWLDLVQFCMYNGMFITMLIGSRVVKQGCCETCCIGSRITEQKVHVPVILK